MSTFTKGPWKATQEYTAKGRRLRHVSVLAGSDCIQVHGANAVTKCDNAALIAAAPTMYEALKAARAKLELWPEGANPEYFPEIKAIDRALRLAEGRNP